MKTNSKRFILIVSVSTLVSLLMLYTTGNLERSALVDLEKSDEKPGVTGGLTDGLNSDAPESRSERIIFSGVPPYLVDFPILDKSIYIRHEAEEFHLGGSRLHLVRYTATTSSGEIPTIRDRDGFIEFSVSEQPYIEFSYREKFYSIRVINRSYSTVVEIREIPGPTVEYTRKYGN